MTWLMVFREVLKSLPSAVSGHSGVVYRVEVSDLMVSPTAGVSHTIYTTSTSWRCCASIIVSTSYKMLSDILSGSSFSEFKPYFNHFGVDKIAFLPYSGVDTIAFLPLPFLQKWETFIYTNIWQYIIPVLSYTPQISSASDSLNRIKEEKRGTN